MENENEKQPLTWPLSKYKGQPLEAVAQDSEYLQWALAQTWFKQRYPGHYTVIINNFQEPSETPEHNAMQALYLEDAHCFALLEELAKRLPTMRLQGSGFYYQGSGFYYQEFNSNGYEHKQFQQSVGSVKAEHLKRMWVTAKAFEPTGADLYLGFKLEYEAAADEEWMAGFQSTKNQDKRECSGIFNLFGYILAEFKPTIGDDYPAILRAFKRVPAAVRPVKDGQDEFDAFGYKVLVYDRFTAAGASVQQVEKIFSLERIHVISQAGINAHLPPPQ